jgi:hypothetical protein
MSNLKISPVAMRGRAEFQGRNTDRDTPTVRRLRDALMTWPNRCSGPASYIRRHIRRTPLPGDHPGRNDRAKAKLCRVLPPRRCVPGACSTHRHFGHQGAMAKDGANLVHVCRENFRGSGRDGCEERRSERSPAAPNPHGRRARQPAIPISKMATVGSELLTESKGLGFVRSAAGQAPCTTLSSFSATPGRALWFSPTIGAAIAAGVPG